MKKKLIAKALVLYSNASMLSNKVQRLHSNCPAEEPKYKHLRLINAIFGN